MTALVEVKMWNFSAVPSQSICTTTLIWRNACSVAKAPPDADGLDGEQETVELAPNFVRKNISREPKSTSSPKVRYLCGNGDATVGLEPMFLVFV